MAPPAFGQTGEEPNDGTQEDNVYGNTVTDNNDILVAQLRMVSNAARKDPGPFFADYKVVFSSSNGFDGDYENLPSQGKAVNVTLQSLTLKPVV